MKLIRLRLQVSSLPASRGPVIHFVLFFLKRDLHIVYVSGSTKSNSSSKNIRVSAQGSIDIQVHLVFRASSVKETSAYRGRTLGSLAVLLTASSRATEAGVQDLATLWPTL